ncbi:hypothetical protein NEMBOFW57_002662 [Staphylotrichum longicolle]|uniref:Uncharacterized protein n=1 Tax=Staphylotrichum longicolle TaxID=669026 RepID=A0AAD4F6H5_9PEZI|nr:hypothetical protein NEMBOFW57_002662 [Staphylotrichum longicolle]
MSFLNTTAKITHTTRLPASTTRPQALAMLSDHVFFLHCDPHLAKGGDGDGDDAEVLPRHRRGARHPRGIWDTNVVSVYEFADLAEGVFVRIRSPLGVVMETVWRVADVEGGSSGENGRVRSTG